MQEFKQDQSAETAHQAILASLQTMEQAKQHAVLWFAEIQKRRLFRELGYPTMTLYARQALGFSSSRASDFSRLAARLEQLSRLRGALEEGEIGYTKANQVARVSNAENEEAWLAEARNSTRNELARKIKRARGRAAARQRGQAEANRTEVSTSSRRREGPPFQIHLHRCPDCERTFVATGRGDLAVGRATAERAGCDARISHLGEPNTSAISRRTRRQVLARDHHRCRRPGCTSTLFLEVHHVIPRARGGGNGAENLVTLCAGCHQLLHEKKWRPEGLVRERRPHYGGRRRDRSAHLPAGQRPRSTALAMTPAISGFSLRRRDE